MATANAISNQPHNQKDQDQGASPILAELKNLVLWRNVTRTMWAFTSILIILVDIMNHSAISVLSMLGITVILGAMGYRAFVEGIELWNGRNNRQEDSYSYRFDVLQLKCNIPQEEIMHMAGVAVVKFNAFVNKMIELLLVKGLCESFQMLTVLFFINMLGDYFNVMTLLLIGHVLLFTLPKMYELRKSEFDKLLIQLGVTQLQEVAQQTEDLAPIQEAQCAICEAKPLAAPLTREAAPSIREPAAPMAREAAPLAREALPFAREASPLRHAAKQQPNQQDVKISDKPLKEQNPVEYLDDKRKKKQDLKFLAMFEEVNDSECSCADCDLLDGTLVPPKEQKKEQNVNYLSAIEEQHDGEV